MVSAEHWLIVLDLRLTSPPSILLSIFWTAPKQSVLAAVLLIAEIIIRDAFSLKASHIKYYSLNEKTSQKLEA